jgi:flagellar protein FliO/FliZ
VETIYLALRVLLSLAVVLAAIWYAHRRLSRSGRLARAAKTVNVVTKQSISAKASVVVMDVDGQRFLLGVTDQSVTVLNTSATPMAEPAREIAPAFTRAPALPSSPGVASASAVASSPATSSPRAASANRGAAFARVLSELQSEPGEDFRPAPVAYLPEPRDGALDGSILSAATWKRTAAALRRAR